MFAALRRDFGFAPVTFTLLAASVVLFIAVELAQNRIEDPKGTPTELAARCSPARGAPPIPGKGFRCRTELGTTKP